MEDEETKEMTALSYFVKLDDWNKKFHISLNHTKKRMLNECWSITDKAQFSQIEINRILPNK